MLGAKEAGYRTLGEGMAKFYSHDIISKALQQFLFGDPFKGL